LTIYPKLYKLKLSNNHIDSVQHLEPLNKIDTLTILDLDGCPVSKTENYRDEVFKVLPKLQVLDMTYKGGEAYFSEDEEFDEMLEEQEEMLGEDNEGKGLYLI
jgi:acidic leucine-rich nuclear phosphoprotein 32 family protein A/C/D